MGTIPKYVYQEIRGKANSRLKDAKRHVFQHFEEKLGEIGNKVMAEELKDVKVETSYESNEDTVWRNSEYIYETVGKLKVNAIYDHKEVMDKIKVAQEPIHKKISQIHADLDKDFETWQIELFTKASEGVTISIPTFEVDYSKY